MHVAGVVATAPEDTWIFVCDPLNTHPSETLTTSPLQSVHSLKSHSGPGSEQPETLRNPRGGARPGGVRTCRSIEGTMAYKTISTWVLRELAGTPCARDLIERFDAEFDRFAGSESRAEGCLGLLQLLGAYETPRSVSSGVLDDNDWDVLADHVGAWWCRVVREDVLYRVLAAMDAIDDSRAAAESLRVGVLDATARGVWDARDRAYRAYVAARWHDAAGRVAFRCADYSESRILFEHAKDLAERAGLWFCLPDLKSNFTRAAYDEGLVVKDEPTEGDVQRAVAAFDTLLRESEQRAEERHLRLSDLEAPENRTREGGEFLRGVSNICHNYSILCLNEADMKRKRRDGRKTSKLEKARLDRQIAALHDKSRNLSERSSAIARALRDGYRLAQALNHQAALETLMQVGKAPEERDFTRAMSLYEEVASSGWGRGLRFVEQGRARLDIVRGQPMEALKRLERLLDELDRERNERGGDLGLDIHFHERTVRDFSSALEALTAPTAGHVKRLREERLKMARSVRRVAKIIQYKHAYTRRILPVFLDEISRSLPPEPRDESEKAATPRAAALEEGAFLNVISNLEEATGRELLDLLQGSGTEALGAPEEPPPRIVLAGAVIERGERGRAGDAQVSARRNGLRRHTSLPDDVREAIRERRKYYDSQALVSPIPAQPAVREVGLDLRRFAANHPGVAVVRYFFHQGARSRRLGAHVVRGTHRASYADLGVCPPEPPGAGVSPGTWSGLRGKLTQRPCDDGPGKEVGAVTRPSAALGRVLYDWLLAPLWGDICHDGREPEHLVLIPSDDLFRLPLHIALAPESDLPLAARLPLSFSVSVAAFVSRGRYLLRTQPLHATDDLCALVHLDDDATGAEIVGTGWNADRVFVAGRPPKRLGPYVHRGAADFEGLAALTAEEPEFFLFSGHGIYDTFLRELGPALHVDGDVITQFDVATRVRLPRNKMTILAACVTGQGAAIEGGGEVAGFLRAFIAAGCGALGLTLWPVLDTEIVKAVRCLLRRSRACVHAKRPFDVVGELHKYYGRHVRKFEAADKRVEACPLVIYL